MSSEHVSTFDQSGSSMIETEPPQVQVPPILNPMYVRVSEWVISHKEIFRLIRQFFLTGIMGYIRA